ncbi:MAG: site-specific integrase [[Clostridium] fimetarium]|nr:site-specific integrase [Alistipes timonensis]MCM1405165.1 site-specific integrase [[Clostridium] fimetarium]
MPIFTICVNKQRPRRDGLYQARIRVAHNGKSSYIPTEKVVGPGGLSDTMEVTDPFVVGPLTERIARWADTLNRHDISRWTAAQVASFLRESETDVVFSDYARLHIDRMIDRGEIRNAKSYALALRHLERFLGTEKVTFSMLTSKAVGLWIASLEGTHRAKEHYPVCVRQMFKAAVNELNDYDNGVIRIKNNPWPKTRIPRADTPEKRAITAEEARRFFSHPLPGSKMVDPLPQLGRDVALMCLCLAGINTVDLYNLRKEDYRGGIIRYCRAKTRKSRADKAYIEMRVPEMLKPVFERYAAEADSPMLLNFSERFSTSDSFCANANTGIKKICKDMGLPKEAWYCVYTFRHTWATTAQNDCGANIAEVGFAMNHSQRHGVTRGYVIPDFTPAWELNEKVIDFILFSDAPSKRAVKDSGDDGVFRLSPKMLIRAAAFFRGKCVASFEDIGCSNIDEVISRLASELPSEIPSRSMVQFKIVNLDNGRSAMYERMKGKGF